MGTGFSCDELGGGRGLPMQNERSHSPESGVYHQPSSQHGKRDAVYRRGSRLRKALTGGAVLEETMSTSTTTRLLPTNIHESPREQETGRGRTQPGYAQYSDTTAMTTMQPRAPVRHASAHEVRCHEHVCIDQYPPCYTCSLLIRTR
jgi:hypothetical protein